MVKQFQLKSKKKFYAPALFVNPQSTLDASELRNTIVNYSSDTTNIEGILVALKDWKQVKQGLNLEQSLLFDDVGINGKIRIIDPGTHIIFQGYSEDKIKLMNFELEKRKIGDYQLISGGLRLRDIISTITALEKNKIREKNERYVNEVYPYMNNLINPIMKYEIENNSDVIIIPSVPITFAGIFERQVSQARKMNKTGKILAETLFSKQMQRRDLMFMLTMNLSIAKQENYDDLISTLIIQDEETNEIIFPDQIGIRLMNDDGINTEAIQSFLDFLARLTRTLQNYKKEIPIHIFNVRENGYMMFVYGATTITIPIATSQYIRRPTTGGYVTTDGKYYHPLHMLDYRYEKLLALSRSFDYVLPCHCKVCQKEKNFLKAKEYWNSFRRKHFLLAKHIEMEEIKAVPPIVLNRHLQQKFSRSKQTLWLAFLDQQPILTFN